MSEELITMSHRELDRLAVIKKVAAGGLSQGVAAGRLGLGIRQVGRLLRSYREAGPGGLVSGHRGRRPGNAFGEQARETIMSLVRERYRDFGPTFASEKLHEVHKIKVSRETLRKWMTADGLRRAKRRKAGRAHQNRLRRSCCGDMIQIDGSWHHWFEDRGGPCTLLVFIDDATSRLMALHFVKVETTEAYMNTLRDYLGQHGRPVAIYSDRHSIFCLNRPGREGEPTQFSRALKTLDIEPIQANTPQAKGRVERANKTLQDRLVKELRLRCISAMEEANAFLPEFMEDYNRRFAVAPRSPENAHREVLHSEEELSLILCMHYQRCLSRNLSCQFKNAEYQIDPRRISLRGARVLVCESFSGEVTLLYKGRSLDYRLLAQGEAPTPPADEKTVRQLVSQAKARQGRNPAWKPPPDHPWRRFVINPASQQQ